MLSTLFKAKVDKIPFIVQTKENNENSLGNFKQRQDKGI